MKAHVKVYEDSHEAKCRKQVKRELSATVVCAPDVKDFIIVGDEKFKVCARDMHSDKLVIHVCLFDAPLNMRT